jgi:superfamily II DNA or RNA helicase
MRLRDHFDQITLQRARGYASAGQVLSVEPEGDGRLRARVSNGRGQIYLQRIGLDEGGRGLVDGVCTCPVGYNCKHVAAALMTWLDRAEPLAKPPATRSKLSGPAAQWLERVVQPRGTPAEEDRPEDYPARIKERLLYVLEPGSASLKIDVHKGRINAAGTALNKSIRRYDGMHLLRGNMPAKFIRPVDLELLAALAQAGLWEAHYAYGLSNLLRPKGEAAIALIRRLCETGRFLSDARPDAHLNWSDDRPAPELTWHADEMGRQRLGIADGAGRALTIHALDGAAIWCDAGRGLIGQLAVPVPAHVVGLVQSCPEVAPEDAGAMRAALPAAIGDLPLPRPRAFRRTGRAPVQRMARLTLGAGPAREGPRRWGGQVQLPAINLRFVYDGHEVGPDDTAPAFLDGDEIVTLARDPKWEADCALRLQETGALPVEGLETVWPSERLLAWDFAFADGERTLHDLGVSRAHDGLDFAFRTVPALRAEGWEITETAKWPYKLSEAEPVLSVTTRTGEAAGFQGNDWFSLGFSVEIDGEALDVAPLVSAFLEQARDDWANDVPDLGTLRAELADQPVYLDRGKKGYVALDLSPLAPLLHLVLTHHAELGALHPSEAAVARQVEAALDGSAVRFADQAGILPLARSLETLAQTTEFTPPKGLTATLRPYQAYGAAWMGSLLEAGFGGVLADDMGLGKTVQVLALLQARAEAGAPGPALLIVPTSLLHSWQTQAAQFTPGLRVLVLHGLDRRALRDRVEAQDLVITTYPLLARDRDWLSARDWPLVILDEAQVLKNPAAQMAKALREIPAGGRLALTGTPLENSLQDIWTLIDWINPGLLGDRKRFQTVFRTPIEKHGDRAAQARLARRLRPFLLRRTKTEVAADLPAKTEILDRVDLPRAQQALYETVRSAMDARVRAAVAARGLAGARITVLDALLKLRQVCCDPALVKSAAAATVTESAKRARLRELLAELVAEGRRVLVFSQFVEMLRLIEADLAEAGIDSVSLTGATRDRAGVLEAFSNGNAPVFLLSLKAGGVGLTLTEADTVILYDPWWNPAVERQAMDRTHRIGQDKPVFVHRLVATGTVEEKILEMQTRKQALADAIFDGGTEAVALDEATLADLFAPLS